FVASLQDGQEWAETLFLRNGVVRLYIDEDMRRNDVVLAARQATFEQYPGAFVLGARNLFDDCGNLGFVDDRTDYRVGVHRISNTKRSRPLNDLIDEVIEHTRVDDRAVGAHADLALM